MVWREILRPSADLLQRTHCHSTKHAEPVVYRFEAAPGYLFTKERDRLRINLIEENRAERWRQTVFQHYHLGLLQMWRNVCLWSFCFSGQSTQLFPVSLPRSLAIFYLNFCHLQLNASGGLKRLLSRCLNWYQEGA